MSKSAARAVADVEKGTILAAVEIKATPERVFKALTSTEDVLRWWGAEGAYRTTEWEADVRPGGLWQAGGEAPGGKAHVVSGEYIEVDAPHKLVFTWRPDWDAPNETVVTYLLEATPTGTLLTLRHEGFAGRAAACRNHGDGWSRVLGLLDADFAEADPAGYFLMRLLTPRPTFPADATPEELNAMRAHALYWKGKVGEGKAIVLGPVADPAGAWGVGVLRATDLAEAEALCAADPVIAENRGFRTEVLRMPSAIHA